jgi:hypothetical protein
MPQFHVSNGYSKPLPGLGKNTPFPALSQKRVSRCVREEALRPRYGEHNVRVTCLPRFDGTWWRGDCEINGRQETFWIAP